MAAAKTAKVRLRCAAPLAFRFCVRVALLLWGLLLWGLLLWGLLLWGLLPGGLRLRRLLVGTHRNLSPQ